jgi:Leucine-rich repeat (LRR) protein
MMILLERNLKNNSLSGSIPESLAQLNQLVYLDLSKNKLTGLFAGWMHRLKSFKLLNLGQNDLPRVQHVRE